jgi:hypothetical protein
MEIAMEHGTVLNANRDVKTIVKTVAAQVLSLKSSKLPINAELPSSINNYLSRWAVSKVFLTAKFAKKSQGTQNGNSDYQHIAPFA